MSNNYFQIPISALNYGLQLEERRNQVLSWACLEYGRKAMEKAPPGTVLGEVETYLKTRGLLQNDWHKHDHLAFLFGSARLALDFKGNLCGHLAGAEAAGRHFQSVPFPLVRIRQDLWFKTFSPNTSCNPLTFREFAVLCAVYCGIGAKRYARLTHLGIRRLAAGCPRIRDVVSITADAFPHSIILSARQVRTTLDALEANGFFSKFTYNQGECFYSNKLSRSELEEHVERRKLRKLQTVASNRSFDQAASRRIKELMAAASAPFKKSA